ncbi:unnamed protein product, partial [Phaeothamnion confervicola]
KPAIGRTNDGKRRRYQRRFRVRATAVPRNCTLERRERPSVVFTTMVASSSGADGWKPDAERRQGVADAGAREAGEKIRRSWKIVQIVMSGGRAEGVVRRMCKLNQALRMSWQASIPRCRYGFLGDI